MAQNLGQGWVRGGDGGDVEVVLDPRFPDLEALINVDVQGGRGGHSGNPGPGGDREIVEARHGKRGSGAVKDYVPVGTHGVPGFAGIPGKKGDDGTFTIRKADIHEGFAGIAGMRML